MFVFIRISCYTVVEIKVEWCSSSCCLRACNGIGYLTDLFVFIGTRFDSLAVEQHGICTCRHGKFQDTMRIAAAIVKGVCCSYSSQVITICCCSASCRCINKALARGFKGKEQRVVDTAEILAASLYGSCARTSLGITCNVQHKL